jgi:hypothetical protein
MQPQKRVPFRLSNSPSFPESAFKKQSLYGWLQLG